MAKHKLTAKKVEAAKAGRYGDGEGLWLVVSPTGTKRWVYRFTMSGRVSEVGLGAYPATSLENARIEAAAYRQQHKSGINPVAAKRKNKIENAEKPTFGSMADQVLEAKRPEWRNQKHADQWKWSLEVACGPLRSKQVDAIEISDVLAVLKPLWVEKPETATRLRQRIEAVLNAAKARGFRTGENPAAWRGHLEHLLPKRPKLAREHHAAMDYRNIPAFIARLRAEDYIASKALEFCILTAGRSGEIFGARWSEIDIASKIWIIPAPRMKAGREHRVPLSSRAMQILEDLNFGRSGQFIFPSPRGDKPLSHVTMQKVLTRLGVEDATVHGFRSSFRDWAGHETSFPREICEQALAHRLGDAAELAYKRGDFLEKRRLLMESWAQHCEPSSSDNVLKFERSGGKPA
jgi:integrase